MNDSFEVLEIVLKAHHFPYVRPLLYALMEYHHHTYLHCIHVAILAVQIGSEFGMSNSELTELAAGGLLHDIGKLSIPVEILDKKGKLSDDEFKMIRRHPLVSYEKLQELNVAHPHIIDEICLKHHVYLNHAGYPAACDMPKGIDAVSMPNMVSIITVADIFGAIVSPRPYHSCLTSIFALSQLYSEVAEGKLDERFVRIIDSLVMQNRLILSTSGDTFSRSKMKNSDSVE